ncbi:MAG: class I SAM-dependent methyltransferase [Treponema sp.]|nr:class I SAM-dependent methyltransferase [Treponema sp.]
MENGETEAKTIQQGEMLANRLRKRARHLRKWAGRNGIGAFRLYDRDIPEVPLVLDLYGDLVSGALYKRPYEKDPAEEERWLAAMREAAAAALNLPAENILIKLRKRQGGEKAQYSRLSGRALVRQVSEGPLFFAVNLSDYLDTGLFLDRRALRRLVGGESAGRRVLNLFCYTGSFSVHAAAGSAFRTDSVDLSNTYLARARDNLALNGFAARTLDPEAGIAEAEKPGHALIRGDVGEFLQRAISAGLDWDLIVVDPPAFSNSAMADDFDLRKDFPKLLSACRSVLAPGGKIFFSASARSFRYGADELESALRDRFPGTAVADIGESLVDEDFKGRKMPRTYLIARA